ncbi:MAG: cytochrome b/b6 domain-containing protein [Aquabacterium sp.]|nr:cytochrome b/b6 domain-containing protein [Aquabacterium sp.]
MALQDIAGDARDQVATAPATIRVELWDLPIRIFHWSLLAAVATAIVTGKLGGEWMGLHGKAGITIVGLIAFRVVWGLVGSTTARFSHFVPTPFEVLAYLQGKWQGMGHNPLGALSVLALLGLLAVQASSGLFSSDDIAFTGPLTGLVNEDLSLKLTSWHHQLANVLFILLGLHVAAIVFYGAVKKDKLLKPMVTGWKDVPADMPAPRRGRRIAVIAAVVLGLGAAYVASGLWIKIEPPKPAPEVTRTHAPAW